MSDILYICDRKRCKPCSNEDCRHTTDIEHAVHFQKDDRGNFWELSALDRYKSTKRENEQNGNKKKFKNPK